VKRTDRAALSSFHTHLPLAAPLYFVLFAFMGARSRCLQDPQQCKLFEQTIRSDCHQNSNSYFLFSLHTRVELNHVEQKDYFNLKRGLMKHDNNFIVADIITQYQDL
jgi:hypothetical protein